MDSRETKPLEGLVIKAQSGFFTVATKTGPVVCELRGRLKEARLDTDPCAIGDRVTITILPDDTGVIENVHPRDHTLSRAAPSPTGRGSTALDREQVIVANPDQVVLVFSVAQPAPNLRKLDRLLVAAEAAHIPEITIVANKIDLTGLEKARALFGLYEQIGYPVLYTSAAQAAGIDALRDRLAGQLSALAGSSGVGKSSLLNAVQPGLGLAVRQVSDATTKGRHTTRHSELFPLALGGYVADTPGIRGMALWNIEPDELDSYFIEMRPYIEQCRFNDCIHTAEPGCAVRQALHDGDIAPERYKSYCRLREEIEAYYWQTDKN